MYLIVKKHIETRFLQDADMFENFKFCGETLNVEATYAPGKDPTAADMLRAVKDKVHENKSVVGVIIPGKSAAFVENHTVYSDGTHWTTVDALCNLHNAPLEYVP